ncbi:MAG TPA: glycosidase [Chloroflexota bacterium]|nr:glycosidase [Chloroflexota bacterium]
MKKRQTRMGQASSLGRSEGFSTREDEREAVPFQLRRLGIVMHTDPARPEEARGVLNPGVARDRERTLWMFPRTVDQHDRSRIIRARVRLNSQGDPVCVTREGVALEPSEPYELRPTEQAGGCEDPRVTSIEALNLYVMTYCAWGMVGARLALACSTDLQSWERLGLVDFAPHVDPLYRVNFDDYYNKDGVLFPAPVNGPDGMKAIALLHRPVYGDHIPNGITDPRPAIWISYSPLEAARRNRAALRDMRRHHVLIEPESAWEDLYIGAGTPPVLTPYGWLVIYHGVQEHPVPPGDPRKPLRYSAGALILDTFDPRIVRYRSPRPILEPETDEELGGNVAGGAVFPTGIDDLGDGRMNVYYGMSDTRIGVARLQIPAHFPAAPTG